ncbi:hypothetical protein [Methylocella silvestris]|uniref:Uncharacterized protein n=1 Tax=Methylocella silvestris TaxID=199596 RepID=A0A2J7TEI3_METSI|nr:hypothetical protein [Methylocella silvestris]PNG25169.1 hypothetical protein CR492_15330 [Methylocella silvestris]
MHLEIETYSGRVFIAAYGRFTLTFGLASAMLDEALEFIPPECDHRWFWKAYSTPPSPRCAGTHYLRLGPVLLTFAPEPNTKMPQSPIPKAY